MVMTIDVTARISRDSVRILVPIMITDEAETLDNEAAATSEHADTAQIIIHHTAGLPEEMMPTDDEGRLVGSAVQRVLFRGGRVLLGESVAASAHDTVVDVAAPTGLRATADSVILGPGSENESFRKTIVAVLRAFGLDLTTALRTDGDTAADPLNADSGADADTGASGQASSGASGDLDAKKSVKKGGKAQHRWSKELGVIEFYVRVKEAKATVVWRKRNEVVIKAGAHMMKETPLNKDGSIGFGARFALTLRREHEHQFEDFVTTEDIVLKSVNEVGHFLYFGGRNSWLELMDAGGRTIDEWTRVEPQTYEK